MLTLLIHLIAKPLSKKGAVQLGSEKSQEILRNAMAYGYEIGMGAPMKELIDSYPDNPFLDPNWRDRIIKE